MTTPKVHRATIICTPDYREWLRARYTFGMKRQPVIANIHSERIRSRVLRVSFGYAW